MSRANLLNQETSQTPVLSHVPCKGLSWSMERAGVATANVISGEILYLLALRLCSGKNSVRFPIIKTDNEDSRP